MTVRRFRVVGDVPEDFRDVYRDRLEEYSFHERPNDVGKEEVEGWVQVHNLLDNSFADFNRWLYNQYAVFSLRVDKKSLPANLFRATLDKKCQEWCVEANLERCPTGVRKQIKEELEFDWLKRAFPRVSTTECCWNITGGSLILHSLSTGSGERFQKRFYRTFGLKLVPWSPLDWVEDTDRVDQLLSVGPSALHGELT